MRADLTRCRLYSTEYRSSRSGAWRKDQLTTQNGGVTPWLANHDTASAGGTPNKIHETGATQRINKKPITVDDTPLIIIIILFFGRKSMKRRDAWTSSQSQRGQKWAKEARQSRWVSWRIFAVAAKKPWTIPGLTPHQRYTSQPFVSRFTTRRKIKSILCIYFLFPYFKK